MYRAQRIHSTSPRGPALASGQGRTALPAERILPYDVRLRREITHRRLVISILRRFMRVVSLHLLDGALVAAAIYLLAWGYPPFAAAEPLVPAVVAIFLLSLNALSAYDPGDGRRDQRRVFTGVCLALLILTCLAVFPPRLPLPPLFLVALGATSFSLLALERALIDQLVRQAYVRGIGLRRAVMIGNVDEVGRALQRLRDDRNIDQYVVGHLVPGDQADPTALGSVADLPRMLEEEDIQEVIVTTVLPSATVRQITEWCFEGGAALFVIPSVIDALDCRSEPLKVGACPLLRLHPARLQFPALLVKRAFDIVLATIALVITAPLMLCIAVAIRLDSPGPVFYRAKRVGLGGQPFEMWKFRSMYADAEQREEELAHLNIYSGGTFKIRNDPRVTRVGQFLRRSSLDELPQLFNVLLGTMSLVGPRPALPADIRRYQPHHFERLTVVPGITGPWQVSGRNLITDFETIVQMEREYITRWSLWLDAKIMLRTVGVVARGDGAY